MSYEKPTYRVARVYPFKEVGDESLAVFAGYRRPHKPLAYQWFVPGGKLEQGETMLEAAIREVYEETAVVVEASRLTHFRHTKEDSGTHIFEVDHFLLNAKGLELKNTAEDEHFLARWFLVEELLRHHAYKVQRKIAKGIIAAELQAVLEFVGSRKKLSFDSFSRDLVAHYAA